MTFTEVRIKLMEGCNETEQVQAHASPPAGQDEGLRVVPLGGKAAAEPRKTGAVDKAEEQAASGGAFPPGPAFAPTTKHTYECLAARLAALEPLLLRWFPSYCADCGLDAARQAGLRYIERVKNGTACDLENGEAYLRIIAFRAARRCQQRELPCVSIDNVVIGSESHDVADEHTDERNGAQAEAVSAALAQLTPQQERAVSLCLMQGLTLEEAAAEMGCVATTVMRHRDRGVKRLRSILPRLLPNLSAA